MKFKGNGFPNNFIKYISRIAVLVMAFFLCLNLMTINAFAEEDVEDYVNDSEALEESADDSSDSAETVDEVDSSDADGSNLDNSDLDDVLSNENSEDDANLEDVAADSQVTEDEDNSFESDMDANSEIDNSKDNSDDELSNEDLYEDDKKLYDGEQLLTDDDSDDDDFDKDATSEDISSLDDGENITLDSSVSDNTVSMNAVSENMIKRVVSFELPDLSKIDSAMFDFLLDPQGLFGITNDGLRFQKNAMLLFRNLAGEYDYSDTSDKLKIINTGNTSITAKIIVRIDGLEGYGVSSSKYFSNSSQYFYFALVDSQGNIIPVDENGFAILDVIIDPNDEACSIYEFGVTGAINENADWANYCGNIQISVNWYCEGISSEDEDYEAIYLMELEDFMDDALTHRAVSANEVEGEDEDTNSNLIDRSELILLDSISENSASCSDAELADDIDTQDGANEDVETGLVEETYEMTEVCIENDASSDGLNEDLINEDLLFNNDDIDEKATELIDNSDIVIDEDESISNDIIDENSSSASEDDNIGCDNDSSDSNDDTTDDSAIEDNSNVDFSEI